MFQGDNIGHCHGYVLAVKQRGYIGSAIYNEVDLSKQNPSFELSSIYLYLRISYSGIIMSNAHSAVVGT
jgi:hypothetical protein